MVDTLGAAFEDVRASVDGALASTLPDLRVTVVGPWSSLTGGRRAPLDDPLLDLRLVQGQYAHDSRVSFAEEVPPTSAPAPFRLTCPAGWVPGAESLALLVEQAEKDDEGLLLVALEENESGVVTARLERTAAVARAMRFARDDESLDDVIADLYGATWLDAESWQFRPAARAYPAWAPIATARPCAGVRRPSPANGRPNGPSGRSRRSGPSSRSCAPRSARGQRDTSRWREKAEQRRLEAVALRKAQERSFLGRATRRLRKLVRDSTCPAPSVSLRRDHHGGGTRGEAGVTGSAEACTWLRARRAWS